MSAEPRLLEVRKNVLKQNDVVARVLRERFRAQGTFVVSLVSSPGAGKTAFLEKTLTLLRSALSRSCTGRGSCYGERCSPVGAQSGAGEANNNWNSLSS